MKNSDFDFNVKSNLSMMVVNFLLLLSEVGFREPEPQRAGVLSLNVRLTFPRLQQIPV